MAEKINNCLSSELIQRYAAGDCSGEEQKSIEEHLKICARCKQNVEAAQTNVPSNHGSLNSKGSNNNRNNKV